MCSNVTFIRLEMGFKDSLRQGHYPTAAYRRLIYKMEIMLGLKSYQERSAGSRVGIWVVGYKATKIYYGIAPTLIPPPTVANHKLK